METFTEARAFVNDPHFDEERRAALEKLTLDTIDPPIISIVDGFTKLPYCFPLQSCYGHFLFAGQQNPHNLELLPLIGEISSVEYRIAYLTLCIEDSLAGKDLFDELKAMASANPGHIQFGSAEWFWERQLNSYVLQVEPRQHMFKDRCHIDYQEALQVERVRNQFFDQIAELLQRQRQTSAN